jgi:CHAT domain-containing protein
MGNVCCWSRIRRIAQTRDHVREICKLNTSLVPRGPMVRIGSRLPLLLLSLTAIACSHSDPSRDLLLLASQQPIPPFDGHLTPAVGAQATVPASQHGLIPSAERSRRWRLAIRSIEQEAARLPPGKSALRLGVLCLATGRIKDAIAQLAAAAAHQPADSDVQNALAVAHLTWALRYRHSFDLVEALAAADRALATAPTSAPIRYNRAVILSSLHLSHQALIAWRAWREVSGDPAASESEAARSFEQRLSGPNRRELWQMRCQPLEQLNRQPKPGDVESLVAEFPYQARLWAETTVLGRWAEASSRRDEATAAAALGLVKLIGAAEARQRRDQMLADTVAVIEAASRNGSVPHQAVMGHLRFSAAMTAYERQDLASAEPEFVASQKLLSAAGSPFAGWAGFYRAICLYYADSGRAVVLFRSLDAAYPASHYPVLNGRIQWLLGTVVGVRELDQEGLTHEERALQLLETSSGEQEAAFVHVLLAETYDPLGEVELSWQHRLQALDGISRSGDHRRIHSMLNEMAQALLRQGLANEALIVLDELLANAAAWPGHPYARAEGLTQRVQTRIQLGQRREALRDIRAARDALATVPSNPLREATGIWLTLYEGLAYLDSQPSRAVDLLTAAFEHQTSAGYLWDRPRYLAERARGFIALGAPARARADLTEAIDSYEHTRRTLEQSDLRMRYFRLAQPAFENLITLDLRNPGAEATAFVTSERARARFLLDRLLPDVGQVGWRGSFPQPGDIAHRLPVDTAFVEYAVLRDEVIAWVVERKSWHLVRLQGQRKTMEADVERFRRDLERGAPEPAIQASAAILYQALIRPLSLGQEVASLIVVPDRFLLGLPFAALYDEEAGRYLVERFAISLSPSGSLVVDSLVRQNAQVREGTNLVVSASAPGAGLPRLPLAELEAREVGAAYSQAVFLMGPDATRSRFLAEVSRARMVHIASHADANAEVPSRSRLFLTPGNDNGALFAAELWQLDLKRVQLLVLASCESMAGQGEGREALFGIAGGLLAAGVRTVVASMWPVDDQATTRLMVAFHRHYAQEPNAARAFGLAVHDARTARMGAPPGNWAAFAVLGGAEHK